MYSKFEGNERRLTFVCDQIKWNGSVRWEFQIEIEIEIEFDFDFSMFTISSQNLHKIFTKSSPGEDVRCRLVLPF